jgi:hypothetical protein
MEFLKYRPVRMMWRAATSLWRVRPLFGRRVVNAYHVPAVLPQPGAGVFFNRCRGRNNVIVGWVEGVRVEDEVTRTVEMVRDGLEWTLG